jgi:hypothetical protein
VQVATGGIGLTLGRFVAMAGGEKGGDRLPLAQCQRASCLAGNAGSRGGYLGACGRA